MNKLIFQIVISLGVISSGLLAYFINSYVVIPLFLFLIIYYLFINTNDEDYTNDAIKIYNLASKSSIGAKILKPIQSIRPEDFEFQFLERDSTESKYLLWFQQTPSGWYDTYVFQIPKRYDTEIIKTYIPHNIEKRSIGVLKTNIMKIYYSGGINRTIQELSRYTNNKGVKSILGDMVKDNSDKK